MSRVMQDFLDSTFELCSFADIENGLSTNLIHEENSSLEQVMERIGLVSISE